MRLVARPLGGGEESDEAGDKAGSQKESGGEGAASRVETAGEGDGASTSTLYYVILLIVCV